MAFTGFSSVKIRDALPRTPLPVILGTTPLDYAKYAALEYIRDNPGKNIVMSQTASAIMLRYPEQLKGESLPLIQATFSDEDVLWYLSQKGVKDTRIIPLIDGNLELVNYAQSAYPHLEYFMSSLRTGERMKKPVTQVQPCIMIATLNSNIIELELPPEVIEYVLQKTPLYGRWLEQHVDKFYELLRRYK